MDNLKAKMTSLTPFQRKHKVTVVGSGNWGSTIAKVVAENTASHSDLFERDVQMWVYEEEATLSKASKHYDESSEWCTKPQKLTHLINHFHENVKYLPGIPLPHNVIANPSLVDSVKDSSILIFNLPHQFIKGLCKEMRGHILPYARGISCIKGVNVNESSISLFSETIGRELDIYCGALSGANIANEVAQEKFSETTIAYDPPPMDSQNPTPATSAGPSPVSSHVDLTKFAHKEASGKPSKVNLRPIPPEYHPIDAHTLKTLFHRRYFHVRVVKDVAGVSLGGALKNIVALAAGFVDGLKWGDNAKAAIMRVGLLEMVDFGKRFFPKTVYNGTFTEESCGVADLITTCAGGRNHRCAKLSIERGVSIEEVEAKELNGQKLQGTLTTREVNEFLKSQGLEREFPLFTAVYNILEGTVNVRDLPDLIEPSSENKPENGRESGTATISTIESTNSHHVTAEPAYPHPDPAISAPGPNSCPPSPPVHPPPPPMPKTTPSPILLPAHPLASSRYHRQALLPSISIHGQSAISGAKVLIIGLGGLGSPASLYLAALGVHTLGLVDADTVELSNLHRQIVHREATVGVSKVASAMGTLKELNSEVKLVGFEERFGTGNARRIVRDWRGGADGGGGDDGGGGWDVVLDCTDNPATRYLVSDACVLAGKVLVSGAAQRTEGQLMVLNCPPKESSPSPSGTKTHGGDGEGDASETSRPTRPKGPCYRCIFPIPPAPETVQSCAEVGVLGPVVGVIGVLMAMEVVKLLVATTATGSGEEPLQNLKPSLLLYSAMSRDLRTVWRSVGLRGRRRDCVACGEEAVLKTKTQKEGKVAAAQDRITWAALEDGRMDYEAFCGRVSDVEVLGQEHRVGAERFLELMAQDKDRDRLDRRSTSTSQQEEARTRPLVIDVREEAEFALGMKVRGSVNVPISRILRHGGQKTVVPGSGLEDLLGVEEDVSKSSSRRPIYFVCQRGNDSQIAARQFLDGAGAGDGEGRGGQGRWIGDVVGGFVALEKLAHTSTS